MRHPGSGGGADGAGPGEKDAAGAQEGVVEGGAAEERPGLLRTPAT